MSKVSAVLGVSAGLAVGALGAMHTVGNYHEELRDDRFNAATAEAFLSNKPTLALQIGELVTAKDNELTADRAAFPPGCLAVIERVDPVTPAIINEKAKCDYGVYSRDRIDEARDLLAHVKGESDVLRSWLEPGSYYAEGRLERMADNARLVTKDAKQPNFLSDIQDLGSEETISISVKDGEIVDVNAKDDQLGLEDPAGFTLLSLLAGLTVAGISYCVEEEIKVKSRAKARA